MKLIYHEGKNFGDALNPHIFETLLPGFFDEDQASEFLGIGSILGLKRPSKETKNFVVFSSGIGGGDESTYGAKPSKEDLAKYDFVCVRGPLTAELFGLSSDKIVCDGAVLMTEVFDLSQVKKEFKYSYVPHHGSLKMYDGWLEVMEQAGIHLIDPSGAVEKVLQEVKASEVVLAEAMHGAITADTLGVPWVPVRSNKNINTFKWNDYTKSLGMTYTPNEVQSLFGKETLTEIFKSKTKIKGNFPNNVMASTYKALLHGGKVKQAVADFEALKSAKTFLSDRTLLKSKQDQLLELLLQTKEKYTR